MTTIIENEYDREHQAIEDDFATGKITAKERNAELRKLERDFQEADERSCWTIGAIRNGGQT